MCETIIYSIHIYIYVYTKKNAVFLIVFIIRNTGMLNVIIIEHLMNVI